MESCQVVLLPETRAFYSQIAIRAGLSLEQVLSDALFRLAGELSLEAMEKGASHPS